MDPKKLMQRMLVEQQRKMSKWDHMVGDINVGNMTEEVKRNVATILESQQSEIMLSESTQSSDVASFKKYAYPLITRIFPTLAVNYICSVQPLEGPVGQIFVFQSKYASAKAPVAAGQTVYNNPQKYYTSQVVDGEVVQAAGSGITAFAGILKWTPITPGRVTITIGAIVAMDDGNGALTGTGVTNGTINYTTGEVAFTLSANSSAALATYAYKNEGNTKIPEVNFEITSLPVQVQDRALRAKWTPQAMQDMFRQHGIMADKAFTEEMTRLIQREISRYVIDTIDAAATAGDETFSKVRPDYISYEHHKQQLIDKITSVSNKIYKKTYRGSGNVIVAGKDALDIIQTLPTFRKDNEGALNRPVGFIGVLNNTWNVVSDIDLSTEKILVGYKGDSFLETGAVYSPYTFMLTDSILLPDDMQARKGILSRDAFTMVNGDFYGHVNISPLS